MELLGKFTSSEMTYLKPSRDLSAFSRASGNGIPAGAVSQNTRAPHLGRALVGCDMFGD